ncbi:MAG: hypothetical protein H6706_18995 [Myxococcales bacterium]|nr:hypothetical protein [Myxococcales bacterium]
MTERDPLEDALAGWAAPPAPTGFADRVLAAAPAPPASPRRWWPALALAAALLVGLGVVALRGRTAAGELAPAAQRTTVTLAARGVAVAEAGAALTWRVEAASAHIEQRQGEVFYRVEGDGPFEVVTPAGSVRAEGSCFSIKISGLSEESAMGTGMKGALVGAVLAAVAVVTVYEGRVALATDRGQIALEAGGRGRATPGAVPEALPEARAAAAPADGPAAEARADDDVATEAGTVKALRAELEATRIRARALQREVESVRALAAEEQARRIEVEGEAPTWPAEMPPAYSADALRQNFTAALKEAGYDGEVTEVDCTEYPCIVYGKLNDHDGTELHQLMEAEALSVYGTGSNNTSAWGGTKKDANGQHDEAVFGIAVHPKEEDVARRKQIAKRLSHRHQQFWDALRAQRGEDGGE